MREITLTYNPVIQTPNTETLDEFPDEKRAKRSGSMDSDDLDDLAGPSNPPLAQNTINRGSKVIVSAAKGAEANSGVLKAIGEFMACGECSSRFTVVSRSHLSIYIIHEFSLTSDHVGRCHRLSNPLPSFMH